MDVSYISTNLGEVWGIGRQGDIKSSKSAVEQVLPNGILGPFLFQIFKEMTKKLENMMFC